LFIYKLDHAWLKAPKFASVTVIQSTFTRLVLPCPTQVFMLWTVSFFFSPEVVSW